MAPPNILFLRDRISRDRLPGHFGSAKSQAYHDPTAARALAYHEPPSDKADPPHIVGVRTIAWNPLSSLVATGSSDKSIRVWNPEKPLVQFSTLLKGNTAPIEKVAFNPVKDAELCSLSQDGVVKFWDVRTKACINEVKGLGDASTLAWAPDGDKVVAGNRESTLFVLSPTQSTPLSTKKQPSRTNDLAFCWSGAKLFTATSEGHARILSFPDLEPVFRLNYSVADGESDEFTLKGHTAECLSVAISPTGRYLATGGSDAIIALWDTTKWICQRTITTMAGPVRSLSFTGEGTYIVGGSNEGNGLDIAHTESGDLIHTLKTSQPVPVVAWAPTRYYLAYSELGTLRVVGIDARR